MYPSKRVQSKSYSCPQSHSPAKKARRMPENTQDNGVLAAFGELGYLSQTVELTVQPQTSKQYNKKTWSISSQRFTNSKPQNIFFTFFSPVAVPSPTQTMSSLVSVSLSVCRAKLSNQNNLEYWVAEDRWPR